MSVPITDRRKANIMALACFVVGLIILFSYGSWWPAISLVIGASLLVKQYFRGRHYDMLLTTFVFVGIYLFYNPWIQWTVVLPVMFAIGGIYILFCEFVNPYRRIGKEAVEDKREEIEDDSERE